MSRVWCIRYCKTCGAGPREQVECEEPDCEIETMNEAIMRDETASPQRPSQASQGGDDQ